MKDTKVRRDASLGQEIKYFKMTYDVQQLIEKCMISQEYGKSQPPIGTTQELPPFPWHTLATDLFYWQRMDFLIVADVFSNYSEKIAKFHLCSNVHRTIYDCHRIRPASYNQK